MTELDMTRSVWRKSRYSGSDNNCIELAPVTRRVAVRDSKNPAGPKLAFTGHGWRGFAARAKAGAFDA